MLGSRTRENYESAPLLPINEEDIQELPTNSWFSTASIIVCSMAGVGVLGIPQAMMNSGWSGVILLVFCALCNIYTGIILGRTMLRMRSGVKDYAEIGEEAFGIAGRRIAQFCIYTTLVGVGIIFLILVGLLMNGIFPRISHGFWTLAVGTVLLSPLAVLLKSYGEIKIVSWFGFGATAVVVIVGCVMSLLFYYGDDYNTNHIKYHFDHEFINGDKFSFAFNVFTFAFGATAIFPNVYVKMIKKADWPKAVIGGYVTSLFLYYPIAIVGYFVYGTYLSKFNTILEAIQFFDPSTAVILQLCSGIMVAHIISAFPVVINPVFLAVERVWIKSDTRSPVMKRLLIRSFIMAVLVVLALFFPYFLDVMSLVSCISVSMSGYILPCLFYWKICKPRLTIEKIVLVFVILFGLTGSVIGIVLSIKQMVDDVKSNPNPFNGLFDFD